MGAGRACHSLCTCQSLQGMVQGIVSSPPAPLAAQLAERASLVRVTFVTQQVSCSAFACILTEDLFCNVLVCCPTTGRRLSSQGACPFVTHSCTGHNLCVSDLNILSLDVLSSIVFFCVFFIHLYYIGRLLTWTASSFLLLSRSSFLASRAQFIAIIAEVVNIVCFLGRFRKLCMLDGLRAATNPMQHID